MPSLQENGSKLERVSSDGSSKRESVNSDGLAGDDGDSSGHDAERELQPEHVSSKPSMVDGVEESYAPMSRKRSVFQREVQPEAPFQDRILPFRGMLQRL